jgi:hypothetical protein
LDAEIACVALLLQVEAALVDCAWREGRRIKLEGRRLESRSLVSRSEERDMVSHFLWGSSDWKSGSGTFGQDLSAIKIG